MKFKEKDLRIATWNIGTLTGKETELALKMKKFRVDIPGIGEVNNTQWKWRNEAREGLHALLFRSDQGRIRKRRCWNRYVTWYIL